MMLRSCVLLLSRDRFGACGGGGAGERSRADHVEYG